MSRIHEALKKAEQDRAGVETISVAAAPAVLEPVIPKEVERAAATSRIETAGALASKPGNSLRFEDLQANCARPKWNPNPNENIFNPAQGTRAAEQFRTLRSRLYQLRSSQQLRTLLVTSSVTGEGKTFVTSNLAHTIIRQPDHRCLIIDADLRCSRLHSLLGAPTAPGLTDFLRGQANEFDVIQLATEPNLCFIPGGSEVTNPSELLSNGRLRTLLDRVAPLFDWIIIDSPPCLPVADASILADLTDGLILVVKARSTPLAVVQRAQQELQSRNIVGVVLNSVPERTLDYASYYTSNYYLQEGQKEPEK